MWVVKDQAAIRLRTRIDLCRVLEESVSICEWLVAASGHAGNRAHEGILGVVIDLPSSELYLIIR